MIAAGLDSGTIDQWITAVAERWSAFADFIELDETRAFKEREDEFECGCLKYSYSNRVESIESSPALSHGGSQSLKGRFKTQIPGRTNTERSEFLVYFRQNLKSIEKLGGRQLIAI